METAYVTEWGSVLLCVIHQLISLSFSGMFTEGGEEDVRSGLLRGADKELYVKDLVICYGVHAQRVILRVQQG